jgi:O-antigen/teichoic acid export membrane protein
MARNKIVFGIGFGIICLGADGIAGVLLLRLLIHYLPSAIAGYWVLVTSAGSLLLLTQLGMGLTLARAIARARVASDAFAVESTLGGVEVAFRFISLGLGLAAIGIFFGYLWPAAKRGGVGFGTAWSWFPYALGLAANVQGQKSLVVLNGYGEVGWDKVFRTVYSTIGIASVWVALYLGLNLPTLGIAYLVLNLLFWFAAHQKLRHFLGDSVEVGTPQKGQVKGFFLDASKLDLTNLMGFLTTQFTVFIVERGYGINQVISYSAMVRVGGLIGNLGATIPQMLYPYFASSWAAQNYQKFRRYYIFGIIASVGVFLALSLPIFLLARPLFELWLGPGQYPGNLTFGAILLFNVIFVHHRAHATAALAALGRAFVVPLVINLVLFLLLIFCLPREMGLVRIPVAMILGFVPVAAYIAQQSWRNLMR